MRNLKNKEKTKDEDASLFHLVALKFGMLVLILISQALTRPFASYVSKIKRL